MNAPKPIDPTDDDNERASVLEAVLDAIRRLGGQAGPADVLASARDPLSPLHRYFTWDDGEAAEKYRLLQAGLLLRQVKYHIVRLDSQTKEVSIKTVRATTSVPSDRTHKGGSRSYGDTSKVMRDDERRASVLAGIVRELVALRNKYATYSELHDVWIVIDDAAAMYDAPSVRKRKRPGREAPPPAA